MKRLGVYLKPYMLESILGPLFKLLEALLELLVPLVVADIIDTGIGAGDSGFIVKALPASHWTGLTWPCQLRDRAVFCGEGRYRLYGKRAARVVREGAEPFLRRAR